MLRRYAALVDSLGGTYVTAADMNTGQADMDVVGEGTGFVLGRSRERGGSGDPASGTALGVFHGIVASVRRAFGSADLTGRSVVVQGAGAVGGRLIELLNEAGATVVVSDVDPPGRRRPLRALKARSPAPTMSGNGRATCSRLVQAVESSTTGRSRCCVALWWRAPRTISWLRPPTLPVFTMRGSCMRQIS